MEAIRKGSILCSEKLTVLQDDERTILDPTRFQGSLNWQLSFQGLYGFWPAWVKLMNGECSLIIAYQWLTVG